MAPVTTTQPSASAAAVAAAGAGSSLDPGSRLLASSGEAYVLALPDLVLMDPLAPQAKLAFKGAHHRHARSLDRHGRAAAPAGVRGSCDTPRPPPGQPEAAMRGGRAGASRQRQAPKLLRASRALQGAGELSVTCAATGLAAVIVLSKDGSVRGSLEQEQQQAASAEAEGRRLGAGKRQPVVRLLGTFSGAWAGRVAVACPTLVRLNCDAAACWPPAGGAVRGTPNLRALSRHSGRQLIATQVRLAATSSANDGTRISLQGLEGIVFDASTVLAAGSSSAGGASARPIMRSVCLAKLGPVAMPRLWAALHDAILYMDPAHSRGGRVRAFCAWLQRGHAAACSLHTP